jgi:hypothetical protein
MNGFVGCINLALSTLFAGMRTCYQSLPKQFSELTLYIRVCCNDSHKTNTLLKSQMNRGGEKLPRTWHSVEIICLLVSCHTHNVGRSYCSR